MAYGMNTLTGIRHADYGPNRVVDVVPEDLDEVLMIEALAAEAELAEIKAERLREAAAVVVGSLEKEAERRVNARQEIEQRWLEDMRQLHGTYDPETIDRMRKHGGSQAFINRTAEKTEALEARLTNLLFPTDDRNWSVEPTPVPKLTQQAHDAMQEADDARARADEAEAQMTAAAGQAEATGDDPMADPNAVAAETAMREAEGEAEAAQSAADALQEQMAEAKRRADAMQDEIDDNLVESDWPSEARDAIRDACQIGFGVTKGPILAHATPQRWMQGENGYALGTAAPDAPSAYRVDPWSVFLDPDVSKIEDNEGVFERHLYNKKQMRRLAQREDVDENAVRRLLEGGPKIGVVPSYMSELQSLSGSSTSATDRFCVWEYTGPIEPEDAATLEQAMSPDLALSDVAIDDDPLVDMHVRIWFCGNEILSFALHPLDSGESLYSIFTIRPAAIGLYGYGVPWIMRSPQSVLNAAWRMMLDNSGLSAGPQILVNRQAVTPANGSWAMEPRKVWYLDPDKMTAGQAPFDTFNIPSNQNEMGNLVGMASDVIDKITAIPTVSQGEPGAQVTRTFHGLALLMNSANVIFQRIVKHWDDEVTVPMIRRFYGWHMQFSGREDIKGDLKVRARGSSVLLVREMQANNLIAIATAFGDHPVYGEQIKQDEMLRLIMRAHSIPVEEVLRTERELVEYRKDMQSRPDPATQLAQMEMELKQAEFDLRREESQTKLEIANMERDTRLQVAKMQYDAALEEVAGSLNEKADTRATRAAVEGQKLEAGERRLATEVAMAERTGKSAGGSV